MAKVDHKKRKNMACTDDDAWMLFSIGYQVYTIYIFFPSIAVAGAPPSSPCECIHRLIFVFRMFFVCVLSALIYRYVQRVCFQNKLNGSIRGEGGGGETPGTKKCHVYLFVGEAVETTTGNGY